MPGDDGCPGFDIQLGNCSEKVNITLFGLLIIFISSITSCFVLRRVHSLVNGRLGLNVLKHAREELSTAADIAISAMSVSWDVSEKRHNPIVATNKFVFPIFLCLF